MKNSILNNKSVDKQNYLFFMYIFKYKGLFNNISQPHLRNIIYVSYKLNANKYEVKIISEI